MAGALAAGSPRAPRGRPRAGARSGSRVPIARCSSKPGRRSARAARVSRVALRPGEDLDRGADRRERRPRRPPAGPGRSMTRLAAAPRRPRWRPACGATRCEPQRSCSLAGVGRVGGAALVGARSPCARRRGRRRARRRAAPAAPAPARAPATAASPSDAAPRRRAAAGAAPAGAAASAPASTRAACERQPRLGQRALDQRDAPPSPRPGATTPRTPGHAVEAPQPRLGARGHRTLAVARAHRRRPVRRPVDEQPVARGPCRRAAAALGLSSPSSLPRESREERASPTRGRARRCARRRAWISGAALVQRHVALREEPVGDAVGERVRGT